MVDRGTRFSPLLACLLFRVLLLAGAATKQSPRTDPDEVRALNSIFSAWRISSSRSDVRWNTTGDPCSGAAISSSSSMDDLGFNPGIKCNCSFDDMTVCHITELKIENIENTVSGEIPEDFKYLTKLNNLQLQGNLLSGSLLQVIPPLTALEKLNLSSNTLTGFIPKELGNVLNLTSLDLSANKFNGSLPAELGNLINLEELKLNSAGVSGMIPETFSKLQKLRILWISDNELNGNLPDFFGQFKDLEDLRLQGNAFQGPIPPSFSNLVKLTRLQIGELMGTSSKLDFIKNMTSLSILILRNSNFSGTIPSFSAGFTNLNHLDLSFNNLSGSLPSSIFLMPSLEYLFLGNNSLQGNLPSEKNSKLLTIDLSYNRLSGSFPSWINESGLRLNLVANDFFSDSSNNSFLGQLRCLQWSFPCHRNSPIHSSFAINCGAPNVVSLGTGPTFDVDKENEGSAYYYVNDNATWALSTVGRFFDVGIPTYIQKTETRFTNTQESNLLQDARLSPSSIRYYGLGLQNGQYNIRLWFGETGNWDENKGRRYFDIFIQGRRVEKDFDIIKNARGNLRGVVKDYRTDVISNFLEIHFFWTGKGTCCIPTSGSYGPSISAISVSQDSPPDDEMTSRRGGKVILAGVIVSVSIFCCILVAYLMWRCRKLKKGEDEELLLLTGKPHSFTYQEIKSATQDFSPANMLGVGGFGSVYKGILSDGKVVAVKQLLELSAHGKKQFITEIATITAVQHRNLVKMLGCCYEGQRRILILEHLENGSLDGLLFGRGRLILDWPVRFRICLGVAKGLAYLHEESHPRIIHRDIKASNILLDSNLNPKISDFGLAKLHDEKKSHLSTGLAGTAGYLAPEYAMRGQLTEKADVFSYGVVLFEILCGRKNTEPSLDAEKIYLLEWVWHLHSEKRELEMLDPAISSYDEQEVLRTIGVAFMCTQAPPARRPAMSKVISMLVGDVEVREVLARPSYLLDFRCVDAGGNSSTSISNFGPEKSSSTYRSSMSQYCD